MTKPIPYAEYLAEVKARVCALCIESNEDGSCSVSGTERCSVERHLERIIQVSHSVEGTNLDDYMNAFRLYVCSDCRQDGEVSCKDRDTGICGLDRYYPLVLDAIAAVERRHI